MEDVFSVAYQQTEDELDLEYAFFGIFDGHGGKEAALFAKEHLMDNITKSPNFWSDDDDLVLKSIREGFLKTQQDMWGDLENWSKTGSGLPSTAGTTASIAFIRRGKIFVGHVGDSGIVLGEQDPVNADLWKPRNLTRDHKPECEIELARIEEAGGKVVSKSGVPRVVWNRPKIGHTGPVRRSTPMDEVPFLAVARALGDLWSYNSKKDVFVVSPDPDLHVYTIDISKHRCLVLGTDGAWNVLSAMSAVSMVRSAEKNNEKHMLDPDAGHSWQNPSKCLVDQAVERWKTFKLRADNTSIVVVMLDPPGPPRAQVLRRQREMAQGGVSQAVKKPCDNTNPPPLPPKPGNRASTKGLSIISRFPNSSNPKEAHGKNLVSKKDDPSPSSSASPFSALRTSSRIIQDSTKSEPEKVRVNMVGGRSSPLAKPTTGSQPNLQVNEVTSSDSESSSPAGTAKSRKSISRELANLALDSPAAANTRPSRRSGRQLLKPKRRGRSVEGLGRDDSDTENMADGGMVPATKLAEVEKKCQDLTNQLRAMEEKVSQQTSSLTQEFRALRSNLLKEDRSPETPPRVLRSKNGNTPAATTPGSGTKRKLQQPSNESVPIKRAAAAGKRERTVTWAGGRSRLNLKEAHQPRTTRKSAGGAVAATPTMGKLRRAKISLKRK